MEKTYINGMETVKLTKAYLMVGIPGSGKSTWIKHNLSDVEIISRDIIRFQLGYTKGTDDKAVLSKEQEAKVTKVQRGKIQACLKNGKNIAIDDINIGKYRKSLIDYLHSCGAYVIAVVMHTALETCIKRRTEQIPSEIMHKINNRYLPIAQNDVDEIIEVPDNTKIALC